VKRASLWGVAMTAALLMAAAAFSQESQPEYREAISVVRYIVDARVIDAAGNAIQDLKAEDFEAMLAGRPATVEDASWVGRARTGEAMRDDDEPITAGDRAGGRLVVFFVVTDFARNASRVKGQMQFNENFADQIFGMLGPVDQVAVLSFDSQLKLRCDFTSNHVAAREALRRSLYVENVPLPDPPEDGPSLARYLDAGEMKKAARGEDALLVVARALQRVEGAKVVIMPSWGLGELWSGRVTLSRGWHQAVAILRRDRVPVISVHTGLDRGSLTVGIAQTAHVTGGVFASAVSEFPTQSLSRIEGFLSGYYEITLRVDEALGPGEHNVVVRARDRRLQVRAAPLVVIDSSDVLYLEAVALFNAGETEAAIAILRDSVVSEDVPADGMVERLRALTEARQWAGALVVIEALERRDAVDPEVETMRAAAKAGMKAASSSMASERLTEARRRLLAGSVDGVEHLLDEAIAAEPLLADAWYERGMIRLATGDVSGAEGDLRRYLHLAPAGAHSSDSRALLEGIAQRGQ
jgi:hypothetical protein